MKGVSFMNKKTQKKLLKPAIFIEKENLTPEGLIIPATYEKSEKTEQEITIPSAIAPDDTQSHNTLNKPGNAFGAKPLNVTLGSVTTGRVNEKRKNSAFASAIKFINRVHIRNVGGQLYLYEDGIYKVVSDSHIRILITHHCRKDVELAGNPKFVRDVNDALRMIPEIVMPECQNTKIVAFKNLNLNLDTWQTFPHTPQIFLTSRIEAEFTRTTNPHTPIFDDFLSKTFQGKTSLIARVWEMMGYILTEDNDGKCFFILQGVGDSGKSVLGRFVTSFFNKDAVSNLDISRLGDKFGLSSLVGKRINANLDLSNGKINRQAISIIKQLTGGDALTGERKFENSFSFSNSCKLLFATNHPLKLSESDDAFNRRVIVIPFERSVPKEQQDKRLFEKFVSEKNAIVLKSLLAYQGLVQNSYIFSGSEYIKNFSDYVQSDCITVEKFIEEKCEFCDFKHGTFTNELYKSFIDFCIKNDFTMIKNIEDFSQQFRVICGQKVMPSKWRNAKISSNSLRGYKGVLLT